MDEIDQSQARETLNSVHQYLLSRGWYRDPDDQGIWVKEKLGSWSVGDALLLQWEEDGFEWPDV